MGIGELILIAVNQENLYLTHQPKITFFKTVYKKYYNFAIETVPQYFKTNANFGKKISLSLSKNADMISGLQIYIELPSINKNNHTYLPNDVKKIKYVKDIGHKIISYVDLEINGIVIDRVSGEWLHIYYQHNNNLESKEGFDKMIGNDSKLTDFTNGKDKYKLNIPLSFWFCQDTGLALPLVSLHKSDIKLHIKFNKLEDCVIESPSHYFTTDNYICLFKKDEIIYQEINGKKNKGIFKYFDIKNQRVYYDKLLGNFQISTTVNNDSYKIYGNTSKFNLLPKLNSIIVKDESYFYYGNPIIEDSYVLTDYIYLDIKLRNKYLGKKLEYLIPKTRFTISKNIYNTNSTYKIPLVNPVKIIFWRAILQSNIEINDSFNYTSYPLTDTSDNLILNSTIILNSIKREEKNNWEMYDYVQNYKNKLIRNIEGVYKYSFSLQPNKYNPSGSLNFSKIDDSYLQLTLNSSINYQNPIIIKLYTIQYNIFTIVDGIGGLKYYQ